MTDVVEYKLPESYYKSELLPLIPKGYDPYDDCEGYHYDPAKAEKAVNFIPRFLSHVKGALAGQPIIPAPWQISLVATLYGWVNDKGLRRYRNVLVYVPRKNGKSTLVGGLSLFMLAADGELGAECFSAGSDASTAAIAFGIAKGMVTHSKKALRKRLETYQFSITYPGTMSFYKYIAADATKQHGGNTHFCIIDELHALGENYDLVDVLETSTGARTQPIVAYITTADFARESICNDRLNLFRNVADGTASLPDHLPWIYEPEEGDDWKDESVWYKVNPNLDVSFTIDFLRGQFRKALADPLFENTFKRLYLNMQTEQETRWLSLESWDGCPAGELTDEHREMPCYVGIDVGEVSDLSAVTFYWPHDHTVMLKLWAPKENKRTRKLYEKLEKMGYMELVDGEMIDPELIEAYVEKASKEWYIKEIGLDPWHSRKIAQNLQDKGLPVQMVGQGFSIVGEPTTELSRLIVNGSIRHLGNRALRWMVGNAVVRYNPDGVPKLDKRKATGKIDGLSALVNALTLAMFDPTGESVYEERGLLTL